MVVGIGALLFQRRFAAPGEEWLAARRASPGSGAVTLGRAERASTAARYGGRTLTTKGAPAPSSESIIGAFSVEGEAESFGHVTDGLVDDLSGEAYDPIDGNPFLRAGDAPLSTFSVDVDTASYSNVRRWISDGSLPPADAVRVEELVNYFPYDYAGPDGPHPFATHVEVAGCPWEPRHRLVRIGIKGREIDEAGRKPSNLVFLLDVSGSMNDPRKLPLLKSAMGMLTEQLGANDRVAIAVYAGAAGLVLVPTPADNRWAILEALERLEAGGSTAGAAGIELAYEVAREHFIVGGNNRVILCTDGDFNVGVAADGSLVRLIEKKAQSGVFLTVLGFGTGNLKDAKMEKLADKGNGNYAYIDSRLEARKVLVEQMGATLETIAKDVKVQVEFNPLAVEGYRLIGYENRLLAARDFADDTKDAGEIGAGHTVTALYEVVPVGAGLEVPGLGPLRYQENGRPTNAAFDGELLFVKLRYKEPEGDESTLIEVPVSDAGGSFFEADGELRFAASVAAFGMLLRGSQHLGKTTLDEVADWALESTGDDPGGYRAGFLELIAATGELRKE
ncbi:MAG: hypothetical protein CMJ84_04200 [Planctomycetes bacterium]|nr:hypothetical protein [Planctomycetota bacterium]